MQTQECIVTRRSVRKFKDMPVAHETIEELVDLAAFAPSWKNVQVTRYIAIENQAKIAEIAQDYAPFNAYILESCPVLMAVTVIKKRSGYERNGTYSTDRGDGWQMFDCGIASQTFCLAAHERGLGTVIMGIFDRLALETYLHVPEDRELVALIALGHPNEEPPAPRRKVAADLLSWS